MSALRLFHVISAALGAALTGRDPEPPRQSRRKRASSDDGNGHYSLREAFREDETDGFLGNGLGTSLTIVFRNIFLAGVVVLALLGFYHIAEVGGDIGEVNVSKSASVCEEPSATTNTECPVCPACPTATTTALPSSTPATKVALLPSPEPAQSSTAQEEHKDRTFYREGFQLAPQPDLLSTIAPETTWPILKPPKEPFARIPPGIPRPFCPIASFDQYAKWHAEILSGKFDSIAKSANPEHRRPRFIIYTCRPHVDGQQDPCGGLADRIVGIVTTVMMGMLSGRVALVDFQRDTKATDVFLPVSIDWSVSVDDFITRHGLNASGDYRTLHLNYHNPTKKAVARFASEKFDDWWHEEIVRMEINRGLTYPMWDNPNYKQLKFKWKWNRETAFACLMDYILTPIPRIAERINKIVGPLVNPLKMTVGLQIRTGDIKAFGKWGDNVTLQDFQAFFTCAEKLQDRVGFGRPLQIFLVSDSMSLKNNAKKQYGDALITTDAVPKHLAITNALEAFKETVFGPVKPSQEDIEKLKNLNQTNEGKATYNETDAYEGALLDLYALSYTPYKVISMRSGFGNVAAFRRYWTNTRAVIRSYHGFNGWTCGAEGVWTNYTDLATHWSMGRRRRRKRSLWDLVTRKVDEEVEEGQLQQEGFGATSLWD